MASQRNTAIDILKGVVIIGHLDLCVDLSECISYKVLHRIIYSFHMPLFFIVAGYFYRGRVGTIWKDVKRLIVPYWFTVLFICLFIAFLSIFDEVDVLAKIKNILIGSLWGTGWTQRAPLWGNVPIIGAIWFLMALFWSKQIFSVLENNVKRVFNLNKK